MTTTVFFLRSRDRADDLRLLGKLCIGACGDGHLIASVRALFEFDGAALAFGKAREIVNGGLIVNKCLYDAGSAELLQGAQRFYDGQRAGIADGIDLDHIGCSF